MIDIPLELINNICSFLDITINNDIDLKYLDNCSICSKLFINPFRKWYCSSKCGDQLFLML